MNILKFFIISLLLVNLYSKASVDELYLESLRNSKQVKIYHTSKQKSLAELKTKTSTLYPTLDVVNTNKYGDNSSETFGSKIDTQTSLSLTQKLFQGGAEFTLSDFRNIVPQQAEALHKKNLSEYYGQFSSFYFQVSSAKEENEKVEALLKNLKKRVSIVKARTKVGQERKADLFALEAQFYRLEAELFTTKAQLKTTINDFLSFSGLNSTDKVKDVIDPLSLKLSYKVDLEKRPDLKNLKFIYESSLLEEKIEKSTYYPQIDLNANYFVDKSEAGKDNWDVSLNIRFNIFDFGQRSSSVQSKKLAASINKYHYEINRENGRRSWDNFVDNFNAKKSELVSLRAALKHIRNSFDEQLKDLKRGLITQIEVIRSLDDVISLEKQTIRSSLEVKSLYYQANAYLGNFPKE